MSSLKYTNYLGEILEKEGNTLDSVGKWEAAITFSVYISRLNYEFSVYKILQAYKYLNYTPIIFNTALGLLSKMDLKAAQALIPAPKADDQIRGYFIYDKEDDMPLSVTLFDYSKGGSKIFPGEKIIVIGFRGTLSLKSTLKDLNALTSPLSQVFKDLPTVSSGEGKAHRGFMNGMAQTFDDIVNVVDRLLLENPDVSRILITGHSLGGAYANLCGLGFANMKRNGKVYPKINIISIAAPKTFSESGRDVFNTLLSSKYMTLDRVVNNPYMPDPLLFSMDIIPAMPPNLYHPGFSLTTAERYSKKPSQEGRLVHVANTRKQAGLERKQAWYSLSKAVARNYNPLPYYPEFFSKFYDSQVDPAFTYRSYKELINSSVVGTVYTGITGPSKVARGIVQKLLGLSSADIEQLSKSAEATSADDTKKLEAQEKADAVEIKEGTNAARAEEKKAEQAVPPGSSLEGGGLFSGSKVSSSASAHANAKPVKYSNATRAYYPNEVVYTCSAITTPVPQPLRCHLGYLGVGWLGLGKALVPGTKRTFNRYAILYVVDGKWTLVSDMDDNYSKYPSLTSNILRKISVPASSSASAAAARKTRKIRSRKGLRKTRK